MAVIIELMTPDGLCRIRTIGGNPCSQNGKMEGHYKTSYVPVRQFLINLAGSVGLIAIDNPGQPLEYLSAKPKERVA